MQTYEVFEIRITKSDMDRIDSLSLGFLVAAAHVCNELNAIGTIMIFEGSADGGSEFVRSQMNIRGMTLARIALSKIHEFNRSVAKHTGELRTSNSARASAFEALKRKKLDRTPQPPWVNDLRNQAISHLDVRYFRECFEKIPANEVLSFFISDAVGHTSFAFAELALSEPLFAKLGANGDEEPDLYRGTGIFMDYMIDNVSHIVGFVHDYTLHCLEDAGMPHERRSETIDPRFLCDPDEASNPLLVARPCPPPGEGQT